MTTVAMSKICFFVKQKPVAAILTRAIVLGLCFFDSASAQSSEEKPEKVFWPREVKISEEVKLEQKTKYGVVAAKRIAGSVVKVVSLDSDSLRIESDGFQGTELPPTKRLFSITEYDGRPFVALLFCETSALKPR